MNEAALSGEDVADLHLVRAAIKDEFLIKAERTQRGRGLDVVGGLSRAFVSFRQTVASRREDLDLLVDPLFEFDVHAEPLAARENVEEAFQFDLVDDAVEYRP